MENNKYYIPLFPNLLFFFKYQKLILKLMMFDTIMGWLTKYILENICSMFLLNFLGKIYRSIFPEFNLIIFKQASIVKNLLTSSVNICLRTVILISKRSYSGGFNLTKKSYLKQKKNLLKIIIFYTIIIILYTIKSKNNLISKNRYWISFYWVVMLIKQKWKILFLKNFSNRNLSTSLL